MSYIKETEGYKGYTIEIVSDDDPQNPRTEYDNAGTMVCWHRRYHLGDMKNGRPISENYDEPIDLLYELADIDRSELEEDIDIADLYKAIEEKGTIISPLYLYDHSGITISMGGFSCPWDSGQVGYIYVTKEQIEKEWNGDYERAQKYLEGEVETYDQYLTGDVWGWRVVETGDSVWGYYGDEGVEYALKEARGSIDYECEKAQEEYEKQPKHSYSEMATM